MSNVLPYTLILIVREHPRVFLPSGYMRLTVIEWLSRHLAVPTVLRRYNHYAEAPGMWSYHCPTATAHSRGSTPSYHHHLSFADKDKAMLFKLTWCGK